MNRATTLRPTHRRMTRRPTVGLIVSALGLIGLSGCSGNGEASESTTGVTAATSESVAPAGATVPAESRDAVIAGLTDGVIIPDYQAVASAATVLATELADVCASPGEPAAASLTAAQDAWRATRVAWAMTRSYRFGPVMELRASSKIDFPADAAKVTALIDGTEPLDSAAIGGLGADQRGLGAIEVVLFGEAPLNERSCEYLVGASGLVADTSGKVVEAWQAYTIDDPKMFIDDTVNGVIFALTDVGESQLAKAGGTASGTPEMAEIDSGAARSALDDMAAVLDGVSAVLTGGPTGVGLNAALAGQSPDVVDRLGGSVANARSALTAIPAPLATTTDTDAINAASQATADVLTIVRAEVASLLGVTLTLGDADGDS
jgi:putative iron-regulated protein